jgi:hypothetical protein
MTDDDPRETPIEEVLARIPDALVRTEDGRKQARNSEGIPLDELVDQPPPSPKP